jgi:hypothetical protein
MKIKLAYVGLLSALSLGTQAAQCWRETPCSGPNDTAFPGIQVIVDQTLAILIRFRGVGEKHIRAVF